MFILATHNRTIENQTSNCSVFLRAPLTLSEGQGLKKLKCETQDNNITGALPERVTQREKEREREKNCAWSKESVSFKNKDTERERKRGIEMKIQREREKKKKMGERFKLLK